MNQLICTLNYIIVMSKIYAAAQRLFYTVVHYKKKTGKHYMY